MCIRCFSAMKVKSLMLPFKSKQNLIFPRGSAKDLFFFFPSTDWPVTVFLPLLYSFMDTLMVLHPSCRKNTLQKQFC